jgi:hypothetical protein
MKPRISKKGQKILRDPILSRALMMCINKGKVKHIEPHPILSSVSYKDILEEAEHLKNK